MIRSLPALALAAGAALLVSCGDISAPLRADIYEWRLTQGSDTLSYHWPRGALPIRVWTQDTLEFATHAETAIDAWRHAFLYREFDAVVVADSNEADVIVRTGFPDGGGILQKLVLRSTITECEALTELDLSFETKVLTLPIHVFMAARFDPELPETRACFGVAMRHELGHALGIFRHSPDIGDIMYFSPEVTELSERDRQTAEVLYHAPVTVTTTRGGAP